MNDPIALDPADDDASAKASDAPGADAPVAERDNRGRWLPGVSPNPQGAAIATYPRDASALRELARQHVPEAVEQLVSIMTTSRSKRIRLLAIGMLLDRAFGKPVEAIDMRTEFVRRENTSPYERARRIAYLLTPSDRSAHPELPSRPLTPE